MITERILKNAPVVVSKHVDGSHARAAQDLGARLKTLSNERLQVECTFSGAMQLISSSNVLVVAMTLFLFRSITMIVPSPLGHSVSVSKGRMVTYLEQMSVFRWLIRSMSVTWSSKSSKDATRGLSVLVRSIIYTSVERCQDPVGRCTRVQ